MRKLLSYQEFCSKYIFYSIPHKEVIENIIDLSNKNNKNNAIKEIAEILLRPYSLILPTVYEKIHILMPCCALEGAWEFAWVVEGRNFQHFEPDAG